MEPNNENIPDVANKKVGNIEPKKNTLEAKEVEIIAIQEQTEKPIKEGQEKADKMKKPLVNVMCKHPDKDELIKISKIKVEDNNKIFARSLWVVEDEEGNIQKGSAIDEFLIFMDKDCFADCYNMKIKTIVESEDSPFLCLKAY